METKGYIAIFEDALDKEAVKDFVKIWSSDYDRLEQVVPGNSNSTVILKSEDEILWEDNLQFRVSAGEDFTWVYLSLHHLVIETSGMPHEENTLPLDVLAELPRINEVVNQENERRLDELEAEGLL